MIIGMLLGVGLVVWVLGMGVFFLLGAGFPGRSTWRDKLMLVFWPVALAVGFVQHHLEQRKWRREQDL